MTRQYVVYNSTPQGELAIALTDHGVMYGAVEFYQAARAEGIKPIIGVEAYVAPDQLNSLLKNFHQHLLVARVCQLLAPVQG